MRSTPSVSNSSQPIRSLHEDEGLAHYEVLLRLRTANGELLEPGSFLRTAADRHLMPAIDRWVLRTLLVWLVNNRKLWTRVPVVFSINVAPQSMTDATFVSYVEACVIKSGVPPQALCFEIKERFASSGNISVAESMNRLDAGLRSRWMISRPAPRMDTCARCRRTHQDRRRAGEAPTDQVARAMICDRAHGRRSRNSNGSGVRGTDTELQAVRRWGRLCAGFCWVGRNRSRIRFPARPPS